MEFPEFFRRATGKDPFPYQARLATAELLQELLDIPTGLGKTAAAVLAWLWRRRFASEEIRTQTPRRLVYCLPMRVLVEQTRNNTVRWLHNLGLLGGTAEFEDRNGTPMLRKYTPSFADPKKVTIHVLMGGEDADEWDIYPERDAILIGTQDMLLSRALNRGYGASRSRWPIQFGLLNTDCVWIFDEIQLMGSGLATTTQLEGLRPKLGSKDGHDCKSVWMSATLRPDWLKTVDFDPSTIGKPLQLDKGDFGDEEVNRRHEAKKPLIKAKATMGQSHDLAQEIVEAHTERMGRTLVVVNTVKRACELFQAIQRHFNATSDGKKEKKIDSSAAATQPPKLTLLHSRLRQQDRARHIEDLLADLPPGGTICVSTHSSSAPSRAHPNRSPWRSVPAWAECERHRAARPGSGPPRRLAHCRHSSIAVAGRRDGCRGIRQ